MPQQVQWTYRSSPIGPAAPHGGQPARAQGVAPVHVETQGYLLRSMTPSDITPRAVDWIDSPAMREGLNLAPLHFNLERMQAFVASFDGLNNHFIGIFDRVPGLLVGFYTLDVSLHHRSANITCGIGEPDYLGRRVLWQTIDALLDHFFAYREVDKITARILARNQHMLFNFIDNTRFVWEARLRRECLGTDGQRHDVLVFAAHRGGTREDGTAP